MKLSVVMLQGPPASGKHKIIKQAVKRILEKNPIPDSVGFSYGCPFLVEGESPWRKELAEGTDWQNPEDEELSLSEVVQMARARMRRTMDFLGAPLWAYSFKEIRPTFSFAVGIGPATFDAWYHLYFKEINDKKKEKGIGSAQPQYLNAMKHFMVMELNRWKEMGFVSIVYCPSQKVIEKTRKKLSKDDPDREDLLSLEQTLAFSKSLFQYAEDHKGIYVAKTFQQAVDMCVKVLEPHWIKACETYEKSISIDLSKKE